MMGRTSGFAASGTALEVARPAADRVQIHFFADGAAFVGDGMVNVTTATGIPVTSAGPVVIVGRLAQKRWTVISAATPRIGVVEYFPDEKEESHVVATGSY